MSASPPHVQEAVITKASPRRPAPRTSSKTSALTSGQLRKLLRNRGAPEPSDEATRLELLESVRAVMGGDATLSAEELNLVAPNKAQQAVSPSYASQNSPCPEGHTVSESQHHAAHAPLGLLGLLGAVALLLLAFAYRSYGSTDVDSPLLPIPPPPPPPKHWLRRMLAR